MQNMELLTLAAWIFIFGKFVKLNLLSFFHALCLYNKCMYVCISQSRYERKIKEQNINFWCMWKSLHYPLKVLQHSVVYLKKLSGIL